VARSVHPVLSTAQLNRATLARQLLLEPSRLDPVAAIERIGGLQAQEPASPYLGLWTRLRSFEAATLDDAFRARTIVKATLMRGTLHAVGLDDYLRLLPAILPMLRALNRRVSRGSPDLTRIEQLAEAALSYSAEPRTNVELREHLESLAGSNLGTDFPWWWVRRHAPFVHVPAAMPWSFGRRPALIAADAWTNGRPFATEGAATEHLVRRYLGAFGPASLADMSAWSGLGIGRLRPAVTAVDGSSELCRFTDVRGRELIDLVGAPRPDADVTAPPRLLPMWDSLVLGHADRTRVLDDSHRGVVIARNGDTLPTFLVDGRVAGLWWAEATRESSRIVLEPFGNLAREIRRALEQEGERLAAFVAPHEPDVYRRYRTSRARRTAG
jgi:winged helix DNA-binding protein